MDRVYFIKYKVIGLGSKSAETKMCVKIHH